MRSEYILLALLVHFTAFTSGRRVAERRPSPVEMDEEAEETIRGFELSPRDRQAVFGDTSELTFCSSPKYEPQLIPISHNQTFESHRLPFFHFQTARRKV
jgi:hypothetical protein